MSREPYLRFRVRGLPELRRPDLRRPDLRAPLKAATPLKVPGLRIPGLNLTSLGYGAGWRAIKRLPQAPTWLAFQAGADASVRRGGKGPDRLRSNLARVTGRRPEELDGLVKAGMRSYARYWYDSFQLPSRTPQWIERNTVAHHEENAWSAAAEARGVIFVLGHLGNWDHAGAWLIGRGYPFTTVAERLEPAELFDRFVAFRESLGMEVIPLTGGEAPPFDTLADRLRAGKLLCLLADRDLSSSGVPVEFFGATATMPAGPASLALKTGAALVPATIWYSPDWTVNIRFHPPVAHTDVGTMTQEFAGVFEAAIAEHPADWHMLQRLWQDDLAARA